MKYYSYVEPSGAADWEALKLVYSEQEIIEETWDTWSKMMKENGQQERISLENCVADWCTVHWASPEPTYKFKDGFPGKIFCIREFNELDPNCDTVSLVCLNDPKIDVKGNVSIKFHLEALDV